ncbi:MAG: hypothetical protein QOF76_2262, partial [Solirubrobacteraceae bacterium]|nr:hypothetical protein [Solirubrobacteraceae bacterium]
MRLAAAALLAALVAAVPASAARARFDTRVFALISKPGFPAMAYVGPDKHVYEGTYDNPGGDTMPSRVFEYTRAGTLLRSWTMRRQDLSAAHGVQVGTMDRKGHLLLLDKSPPRVVRLTRKTGRQVDYARFPTGAVPNYAAWGPGGVLYVTDYEGATIWRIPRGGGTPEKWFTSPALDGGPFGTTGIAMAADHHTLVIGQQSAAGFGAGNPSTGRLYTLPIEPGGGPGPLTQLWESGLADGPDGLGIAQSGRIYVACLLTNQLVVVNPDGTEQTRFPAAGGVLPTSNGSAVPFDAPSSVRFLGTRLMVANQSYLTGT